MSVDEQLLGRSGREGAAERSGNLRQSQRQSLIDGKESLIGGKKSLIEEKEEEGAASLREQTLASKRDKDKQKKDDNQIAAINPFRRVTSGLLRQAWLQLISSFGLTLIWINIHVGLNKVFGEKFFCELGDEIKDVAPAGIKNEALKIKSSGVSNISEKMGLGILDAAAFLLVLIMLVIAGAVLEVVSNPVSSIISFTWHWVIGKGFSLK